MPTDGKKCTFLRDGIITGYIGWEVHRLGDIPDERLYWEVIITDSTQAVEIVGTGVDERLDTLITELTALRDALVEDEK